MLKHIGKTATGGDHYKVVKGVLFKPGDHVGTSTGQYELVRIQRDPKEVFGLADGAGILTSMQGSYRDMNQKREQLNHKR
jgi:hypothetical protein